MPERVGCRRGAGELREAVQPRRMCRPSIVPDAAATGFAACVGRQPLDRRSPGALATAGVDLADSGIGGDHRFLESRPRQARRERLAEDPAGQIGNDAIAVRRAHDQREVPLSDQGCVRLHSPCLRSA